MFRERERQLLPGILRTRVGTAALVNVPTARAARVATARERGVCFPFPKSQAWSEFCSIPGQQEDPGQQEGAA